MTADIKAKNLSDRRGSEGEGSEPGFLVIGQITKPHGVRGDVRVIPYTDLPERFEWLEEVYVGEENPQPVPVENARLHNDMVILKLAGCDSREAAELLRGEVLQVPESDAIPLEENEYFLYQLAGLVVETDDGVALGTLVEVLVTGANNVFVVRGPGGDILVPDIPQVIQEIDFEGQRMTIRPLPGLLDA